MNCNNRSNGFRLTTIAAALLTVLGSAQAEEYDDEVQQLITPDSSISVGVAGTNNTNNAKRFGQYTGMNQGGAYGLADFELNKRDDASGTWSILKGRNLGLDTRELSFSQKKQGDWKYALDYNEIVRNDPYVIHTGMTGIGTATPTVNLIAQPAMPAAWATANGLVAPLAPAAAADVSLKLKRTAIGLSGEKWIFPELLLEVNFRNETKTGARMFGRAGLDSSDMQLRPNRTGANANGGWAVLLTPEPINSTIRQVEATLNWNRDKFAATAGYYGSFYINNFGSLSPAVPGTLNRGALWTNCATAGCSSVPQLASSPVALPPDNQAHQLYLSGNYAFTQDTRSNFKLAYTHATQNESFAAMGLTPAATAPASLNGVVDTTLVQLGVTSRATDKLSLNGSLRYEDRADKTPIYVYNTNGIVGNALNGTTNWPSGSQTRTTAKLDGTYRFGSGYSTMLGIDWERKVTPLPPSNTALFANQVLFRPALNEYGVHGDLRKVMSESLNGAIGFEYKQRRGGANDWVTTSGVSNANPALSNILVAFDPAGAAGNRVLPQMYMDRDRTKLRGNLDWEATDKLSLQTVLEHTQDDFLRPFSAALLAAQVVPTIPGARTVISDALSLDSSYRISVDWSVNGFWTYSYNRWNVNKASLGDDTRNTTNTVGLGVKGNMTSRLSVGMNVLATRDVTTFNNYSATSNVGGAGNIAGWVGQTLPGNYLPAIHYNTAKLDLLAKYAIEKNSDVQMNVGFQHFKTDDWQWGYNGVPFVYSDNTTVSQPMTQNLWFIAARYIYKM